MIQPWIRDDLIQRCDRSRLGIRTAEHQPGDPRVHQRTSAHRTRLLRDDQRAPDPPLPQIPSRRPKRDDLGVRRWIMIYLSTVPTTTDDTIRAAITITDA